MAPGEVRIINGRLSLVTMGEPYPSNHWWWRTIRADGTLGKEYSGYNNGSHKFSRPIEHEILIRVNSFDILKVTE